MTMNRKSLALVLMSAIFFTPLGVILVIFLPLACTDPDVPVFSFHFNYFAVVPIVLGLISLYGSIVLPESQKKQTTNWYGGIPLCIATAVVIIASLLFLTGVPFVGWNALQTFILLAPCAAIFFYSEKNVNGSGMGPVIVSLVISILPAILLYGIISRPNLPRWNMR